MPQSIHEKGRERERACASEREQERENEGETDRVCVNEMSLCI